MESGTQTLLLSAAAWDTLARHAASTFPEECCGILVGQPGAASWTIHSAQPCPNLAPHSRHARFLIDPQDILDARRRARDADFDIVGFYHSHPGKPAFFSARDLRECWPGYPNIVIPVLDGVPGVPRAFLARGNRTASDELVLIIGAALTPSSEVPPR